MRGTKSRCSRKNDISYDLIILGGGSGDLTAARLVTSLGARTLLIEKERLGRECLYSGCVPSKSLIYVACSIHQTQRVQRFSGKPLSIEPDMARIAAPIQDVIEQVRETERP